MTGFTNCHFCALSAEKKEGDKPLLGEKKEGPVALRKEGDKKEVEKRDEKERERRLSGPRRHSGGKFKHLVNDHDKALSIWVEKI